MGKIYVEALLLFSLLLIPFPMVRSIDKSPKGVEKWFKNLSNKREKIAKLHFYLHHTSMGKTQTTYQVAQPNMTVTSSPFFGIVRVNDDLLKVGPQQGSTTIGYAQGIQASASLQNEIALAMNFNLVFTNNKYNGSTLGLLGRNEILSEYREMSVIGGSGHFRLARGIATLQTVWQNLTSGNAIIEYNLMVLHY